MSNDIEIKYCRKCKKDKPIDEFYLKQGHTCSQCLNERSRIYYHAHREETIIKMRLRRKSRKERRIKVYVQRKKEEAVEYPYIMPINELSLEIEETFCTHFGCGKPLSLIEKLAGCVCSKHMNNKHSIFHNGLL